MTYLVKEIFGPTVQGEGAHSGKACVFLRFAACNLACSWCDTDFDKAGANKMSAREICEALLAIDTSETRMVVITGGEPMLQWDPPLADALREIGFTTHMESNGTRALKAPVDWLTISPKPQFHAQSETLAVLAPQECKVVVDDSVDEATLANYEKTYRDCQAWFVQPCDGPHPQQSLARTLALVQKRPRWRVSMQLHKIVGLP